MANPSVNPEFVERYQLELSKNPRSRVFAPLAEAYRKMGLLDEARRICRFGCQAHPDFAGGHVAYAKVLLDLKPSPEKRQEVQTEALSHLESAAKLSPDNLLAHTLMGETLIELRRPKEALKAFKMVLFLDPENARATQAVRKWEFLTADEYSDDVFAMKPLFQEPSSTAARADEELEELLTQVGTNVDLNNTALAASAAASASKQKDSRLDLQKRHQKALERAVSLADAFTVRNDLEAALQVLEDARRLLGPMGEIESRYKLLNKRLEIMNSDVDETSEPDEATPNGDADSDHTQPLDIRLGAADLPDDLPAEQPSPDSLRKRKILEHLLQRINERRGIE